VDDNDILWRETGQRITERIEGVPDERDFARIKAHQKSMHPLGGGAIQRRAYKSGRDWTGRQRAFSLAANNGVREMNHAALNVTAQGAIFSTIVQETLQVERSSPDSLISVPRPFEIVVVAKFDRTA
jgi:protein-disulfide isomerase-like protein with CxxC motif